MTTSRFERIEIRPRRLGLVGLLAAMALAAMACSSGQSATIGEPATSPTATSITTTSTTGEATTATVTSPPSHSQGIELAGVTIDAKGIESVAPVSWTEGPPGVFQDGDGAQLAFGAIRTWQAPAPAEFGLEPVDRLQVGDRWWDMFAADTPEATVLVAVTGDELMSYWVELVIPPGTADRYIDAVGTPALEAFEVTDPNLHAGELKMASVAIDGRAVAYATGGSGDVTVVFESGWGNGMSAWAPVGDDATRLGRVFAYDRPGYGHSDPIGEPRDGARIVEDLQTTLDATGHQPPYVLVGHSLGGLYMELYARTHPDEVAGLVLVDASTANQVERCIETLGAEECNPFTDEALAELPEPHRSEGIGMDATQDQVQAAPALAAVPTVVLVAGQHEEGPAYGEYWSDLQQERAAELGAQLVPAEDAGHFVQVDRPDLVLQAIEDVIEQHHNGTSP